MNANRLRFSPLSYGGVLAITLLVCCLAISPVSWNESVENFFLDLQYKFRGERLFHDDVVLVHIDANDLHELNGWPITRDYFGYMAHILKQLGAKVIGFDIMFDNKNLRYPEFDEAMCDLYKNAGNVVLPYYFKQFKAEVHQNGKLQLTHADEPVLPFAQLLETSKSIGFSNLGYETIQRKSPLVALHNDTLSFSFGFELAREFLGAAKNRINVNPSGIAMSLHNGREFLIKTDSQGQIILNHVRKMENIHTISFIDLLQSFQYNDVKVNFKDKLVLVAVTAPGITASKVSPINPVIPASLVHLTAAENIIAKNYLKFVSVFPNIIILILSAAFVFLLFRFLPFRIAFLGGSVLLFMYFLVSLAIFKHTFVIMPLFYPAIMGCAVAAWIIGSSTRLQKKHSSEFFQTLNQQIIAKENELDSAHKELQNILQQFHEESQDKKEKALQYQMLLDQEKQKIISLEKQIRDLQVVSVPELRKPAVTEIIYAENSSVKNVLELIAKIGSDDIPVLISGETGTGKELVARMIHKTSTRSRENFIAINCGALPETLLESELFGHEKGSFTGAHAQRKGRFELANRGTLFLDEITETSQSFQAKLLRVLQEGTFERLGGERTIKVNVRIIAASSRQIKEEVEKNALRQDLYYRLNGFPIEIPPLRERSQDIALLISHFLAKHDHEHIANVSQKAMDLLVRYKWPGNVRELENVIRRAAILAESESRTMIQAQDLPDEICEFAADYEQVPFQNFENQILQTLRSMDFSHSAISRTAKLLGGRDRGTITEYFRGICFEHLVKSGFNIDDAAKSIVDNDNDMAIERVKKKIESYLVNLHVNGPKGQNDTQYKGLPQKYYSYLDQVIDYYKEKSES